MHNSAEKYFNVLYGLIQFPIQVVNTKGHIIYVNGAFTSKWDYELTELKEYSVFEDIQLRKSGIQQIIKQVFESGDSISVENYSDSLLNSKEITIPFLKTTIFPITLSDKNYVVLFHLDQTDMLLAEEEVKKARDGLKEAERLKNTFLNVLSHELRTPLNIILGYASIIKDNLKDKMNPGEIIYLDNLYSGSQRLFKSITQMLEFAQLEAGNYKLNIKTVDLNMIIKNSADQFKSEVQDKKIELKTQIYREPVYVDVDTQCVENALYNLVSNAVKFTKQGFIEIEVNLLEERELAVCRIKDSGVGISSDYIDHLFQPFSQEDLNIGRNFEGNGLGLALTKRYIEKMGGSLLVESIKGVGSTFTLTLPISQSKKQFAKAHIPGVKNHKRILMLDDSSESYDLLKAFLKNKYEIESHNFRDFKIDLIEQEDHGIIIFDVNPNHWTQGLLICKDLKKKDTLRRPLIIISSEFMEDRIEEFFEAGADRFIVKPFTRNDLINAIEEVTSQDLNFS